MVLVQRLDELRQRVTWSAVDRILSMEGCIRRWGKKEPAIPHFARSFG
jgi:hypothetical protein